MLHSRAVHLLPLGALRSLRAVCGSRCYSLGMTVGYGSPHTLTPTGVKTYNLGMGDAQCLKPTLMVFAPAVLDKVPRTPVRRFLRFFIIIFFHLSSVIGQVYVGLNAKIAAGPKIIQKLFAAGCAAGAANFDKGVIGAPWFYDKLIFKKAQALLGGKLKAAITGGAPLSPGIQKFAQTAFNCPVCMLA